MLIHQPGSGWKPYSMEIGSHRDCLVHRLCIRSWSDRCKKWGALLWTLAVLAPHSGAKLRCSHATSPPHPRSSKSLAAITEQSNVMTSLNLPSTCSSYAEVELWSTGTVSIVSASDSQFIPCSLEWWSFAYKDHACGSLLRPTRSGVQFLAHTWHLNPRWKLVAGVIQLMAG